MPFKQKYLLFVALPSYRNIALESHGPFIVDLPVKVVMFHIYVGEYFALSCRVHWETST